MKMEVPGLADSLQQCLCVNSGIYAGDVLDTDPGWQQSKLIWALSAEVGSASRMHCTGPWHVKATQQPFVLTSPPLSPPGSNSDQQSTSLVLLVLLATARKRIASREILL